MRTTRKKEILCDLPIVMTVDVPSCAEAVAAGYVVLQVS
jgi:hypothetical protein